VGFVTKRAGFAIFWLFYDDAITRTKGQNCGSKFGYILGCNLKL